MRTFRKSRILSSINLPSLVQSNHHSDLIPNLQRTIGNQAVQRFIQRKLTINTPGDRYEQEADHIADQVMRTSASPCACGYRVPSANRMGAGKCRRSGSTNTTPAT